MKINKIPFFVSTSLNLRFSTAERLPNMTSAAQQKAIKNIIKLYQTRGFKVTDIKADGQYEPLQFDLAGCGVTLNIVSCDEHVPEIE